MNTYKEIAINVEEELAKYGDLSNDDEDDELANLMYGIAITLLVLFALVGIAGLAGFLWGML